MVLRYMGHFGIGIGVASAVGALALAAQGKQPPAKPTQEKKPEETGVRVIRRSRPNCPIRLGGVFLFGLGETAPSMEESAKNATPLSEENRKFLSEFCDVAAFSPRTLKPDTLRLMAQEQSSLKSLITLSASTLSETEGEGGSVGGWRPEMLAWTLRDEKGAEIPHPDKGAHWMDFGNLKWAAHWRKQATNMIERYGAAGVLATELPLGNTSVGEKLQKYKTRNDRGEATLNWLRAARNPERFLLIPSALGFDEVVGHSILPLDEKMKEAPLEGRYWDYFAPWIDGAWAEGWLQPYWSEQGGLPFEVRDIHLSAMNRAGRNGQILIATAAYRNDAELETLLAHFLMVSHRQGAAVFQPMPILPGMPPEAGMSVGVFRQQVKEKAALLQVSLGLPAETRIHVVTEKGFVLRRRYQAGVAYVNPSDTVTVRLPLASPLKRVTGESVQILEMAPRSGVILLYPQTANRP